MQDYQRGVERDYYQVIGLPPEATSFELRERLDFLEGMYPEDTTPGKVLRQARAVLLDEARRAQYDRGRLQVKKPPLPVRVAVSWWRTDKQLGEWARDAGHWFGTLIVRALGEIVFNWHRIWIVTRWSVLPTLGMAAAILAFLHFLTGAGPVPLWMWVALVWVVLDWSTLKVRQVLTDYEDYEKEQDKEDLVQILKDHEDYRNDPSLGSGSKKTYFSPQLWPNPWAGALSAGVGMIVLFSLSIALKYAFAGFLGAVDFWVLWCQVIFLFSRREARRFERLKDFHFDEIHKL